MTERKKDRVWQRFSEHGTRQAYEKGGCRCRICNLWKTVENAKKYKARKKRQKLAALALKKREAYRRGEVPPAKPVKLTPRQEAIEESIRRRTGG